MNNGAMRDELEILTMDTLFAYEKTINKEDMDINGMVMPGTLEDKHKNIDPKKGIPLLRRHFNTMFIFTGGKHSMEIGLDESDLRVNDLVVVPENMVSSSRIIKNCRGYCMHFKTEFMMPLISGSISEMFPYYELNAKHIINLKPEESEEIQNGFRNLLKEFNSSSPERILLIKHAIFVLLLKAREYFHAYTKLHFQNSSRSFLITQQFKSLVEKNFLTVRSVQDYAELMHITPKYLGDCVKENLGKTPGELIQEMILLEAKVLLRSTKMTVSQIAYQLNFEDQSYFSKVFKKHTLLTPQEFRANL